MALKVISVVFIVAILFPIPTVFSSDIDLNDELTIFDDIEANSTHKKPAFGVTLPGTKWCGPGDTAQDDEDLGNLKEVDTCCRGHDNCDDIIYAGETQHGLTNPDLVTRLNCKCEKEFQTCLRTIDSYLSSAIGITYTTARKNCFKFAYPIKKCMKYQEGYIQKRCIKYKLDKRKPKEWQWFDIPFY